MSNPVSHHEFSLVAILLIALVAWAVLRRMRGLSGTQSTQALPKSAPAANRMSRVAESLILLWAALAILVFTATNTSTGGRLLTLDQYRPGFVLANVAVAVAAVTGVILGVLITLFRRTSLGVLTTAAALCGYGMMLNGPHQWLELLALEGSAIPDATLTFRMTETDAADAELWVNGVRLGTLPYETTFDEFFAEIPYWLEEPNENKPENMDSWLRVPNHGKPGTGGSSYCAPWAEIEIPKKPVHWDEMRTQRIRDPKERERDRKARTYYARVRLGDEWGYAIGGSGSSSGGGGRYDRRHASVHFGCIFPERQKRIEKLLDVARLYDYTPQSAWFEAMETYRSDGWLAVRRAMESEPEMSKLLDAWATWRYGLDEAADPKTAWGKFEQICEQAERRQYYMTSDIAGRAVKLLVGKLDQKRLMAKALSVIRSTQSYGWHHWQMNDELQFGFSYAPAGLYTGANRILGDWLGGGGRRLSLGDYAVAHAVWKLDEILDSQDDTKPNAVESELVPAFIAATFKQPKLLGIAVAIGGSDIEQYLLRQNWRADPTELPWRQQVSFYGEEINGWLYLLANLQSPTGREFRRERSRLLMNMADNIRLDGIEDSGLLGQNPFGFLFLDKRLALEYWPRFKVRTVTHARGHDALKHQFRYLVNMEPLTTVEMYVEACRGYSYDHSPFQAALSVLDDLPDARRQEIISSLEREIQEDVSYIDGFPGDEADLQAYLLRHIKTSNWTNAMTARDIFENLRAGTDEYKPQGVADWLENAKPDHPLLKMLAEASEPELRLLVMGALKEHPTPANRQILEALLQDGNEQVRKAAQEVEAELTKLKETPAVQFAAGTDEIRR